MSNLISKESIEEIVKRNNFLPQPANVEEKLTILKKFEVRDDDIFLIGIPKSGTTWAQEMVWLIGNNLDFEGAKIFIDERFPNLELGVHNPKGRNPNVNIPECHWNSVEFAHNMKSPRFIKTHLSLSKLPEQLTNGEKKAKMIYITRNYKDVFVSAYHYSKYMLKSHTCSLDDFCKLLISGGYSIFGSPWESLLYFWDRRNEDNVLFIKYEEMKSDLSEVIQKVAKFLDKPVSKEQEQQLIKWLNIEAMKHNSAVNHENVYSQSGFIRVGKVGGHKNEMSAELIALFDVWIKESLKNSDYEM